MLYLCFSIRISVYYIVIFWFGIVVKMLQVLCRWRWWVAEQHLKQEQAAGAALVHRDEPLMEDLKSCLTYAAHMKDPTAGPAEDSQEQVSASGISHSQEIMVKNTCAIIRCPRHNYSPPLDIISCTYILTDAVCTGSFMHNIC